MPHTRPIRVILIGTPGSSFRLAAEMAREAGAEVYLADTREDALILLRASSATLVMIDIELDVPRFMAHLRAERFAVPVIACGIDTPAAQAVAAIRAGARDYLPLPPQRDLIAAAIASVAAQSSARLLGEHPAFRRTLDFARAMAHSRAPLIIQGEAGTGKELVGREIHAASGRAGRFLVLECAGVLPDILDSELFGHQAGAFPGAAATRIGRLEKAAEGTLFLRNVDCLSPTVQARLATALQEGRVRRIGGSDQVALTARLIVSTSADLDALVAAGSFRSDLLARLGLARVTVPPLRDRMSDLPLLAQHFAARFAEADGLGSRGFSTDALALLGSYGWPGNVRELKEAVHRAVLLSPDEVIAPDAVVLTDGSRLAPANPANALAAIDYEKLVGRTVEEVERELILETLRRCQGNRTSASSILGISVRTMRNKLKSFIEAGIPVAPAL